MNKFMLGSAMAVSLLLSSPGFAGGVTMVMGIMAVITTITATIIMLRVIIRRTAPGYNYDYHQRDRYYAGAYGYRRHHDGHSPLGIILGGVVGGFLGSELTYGDPFATGAGAIAGGVIGHELGD